MKHVLKKEGAGYFQEQHGLSQRKTASQVQSIPKVLRYKFKRPDDGRLRTRLRELAEQQRVLDIAAIIYCYAARE